MFGSNSGLLPRSTLEARLLGVPCVSSQRRVVSSWVFKDSASVRDVPIWTSFVRTSCCYERYSLLFFAYISFLLCLDLDLLFFSWFFVFSVIFNLSNCYCLETAFSAFRPSM